MVVIYVFFLAPWLFVWTHVMAILFDVTGVHFWNALAAILFGLYPISIMVGAGFAWRLKVDNPRSAIVSNLIPVPWVIAIVLLMGFA